MSLDSLASPTRRRLAATLMMLPAWAGLPVMQPACAAMTLAPLLQSLEDTLGCRLGMYVRTAHHGTHWGYRGQERFPLNSTFKTFACAAVLAAVERGQESLHRRVRYVRADLVAHSPYTQAHAGGAGVELGTLCKAANAVSDNTAANLILDAIGGPIGLTAYMRSLDDTVTQLYCREPALNDSFPGDLGDTTTPQAAAESLTKLLFGAALAPSSRRQLMDWMSGNQSGRQGLRAGMPSTWRVVDRTGAGAQGARSVIAAVWPGRRNPFVVAVYMVGSRASIVQRDAALAQVGRALAQAIREASPPG